MEDLALLSLLETLKPSPSSFLASVVADACGGEALFSASTFSLADASIPIASLIRVTRSIFVDALSRSATEPSFSERLIKAGVSPSSASLLSAALFSSAANATSGAAGTARSAVIHAAGGGGGASRLIDFDWTAKATLASSALQGPKAQSAILALTLRTSTPTSTTPTTATTVLELSRNELNAMIEELEAVHDSMNSI